MVLRQSLDEISRALFDRPQKVHESWVSSTGQTKTLEGPVNPSDRWWRVTILNHVACEPSHVFNCKQFQIPSMQGVDQVPPPLTPGKAHYMQCWWKCQVSKMNSLSSFQSFLMLWRHLAVGWREPFTWMGQPFDFPVSGFVSGSHKG